MIIPKGLPFHVIALDPGTTTGFAVFILGKVAIFGEIKKDDIFSRIDKQIPDVWVIENYRVRPYSFKGKQTKTWDNPFALQVIGAVRAHGQRNKTPVIIQEPAIKPIGYGYLNMPYVKGKKNVHHLDAISHGAYYFVKEEGVTPTWLQERQKEPLPEIYRNYVN